ncbi:unnamed protein product (macronuclear) [Paramecium tetraurelia]|uniref:DUF4200 domain-containing protein n=1 Tax=Paramecium tetraurelia TaxID=5888 RepID=A0BQU0_PARTE|nr:uncharacterized protein GSPATT00031136001 [Paramecium tetraurelia]CAK60907.1 unnamed protein product [Paramecium tetraurelia]|eukprot:XP_001428305.1 hypothetical protein (macronuclear) [Paramecium tetraurelia strain d4-2]
MQKIKQDDDEEFNFRRQFEIQQNVVEPKQLSKFKDILNQAIDLNKRKKNELATYNRRQVTEESTNYTQQQLDLIQEQTDEVLTYQQYLKTKLDEILKAKLLTDRKINYYQDNLRHIKTQPDHVQRELDDQVKMMLKKTQTLTHQFQKEMEQFKSQSEMNQEKYSREVEICEQEVKEIQLKIKRCKQKNSELLKQIRMLTEQEEQKKHQLQECFKISEYIEFFMDAKLNVVDQIQGNQDQQQELGQTFQQQQIDKTLTRHEILNQVDEFYKTQDIDQLTKQIISTYHYLLEHQNMQTNEYNFFTEEKALRQQQILQLNYELSQLKSICNIPLDDQNNFGSYNNTIIEGPQIIHENYQLNFHLHGYQLCIITIYQKLIDMIQRLCINVIWLSETTKSIPKTLDNKCMQYLKNFTKTDFNLYVPLATQSIHVNKSTTSKHFGQYVCIGKRNGSITSEEIPSEQKIESMTRLPNEQLAKFKMHKDYEFIINQWNDIIRNDFITQTLQLDINFDNIDITLSNHEIICQMYDQYSKLIKEADIQKHFQIQFSYYRDIMRHIYKNNQNFNFKALTLKQKFSNEVTSPYLLQIKQIQLKRLQEQVNNSNLDDECNFKMHSNRAINASDDRKYHEYFIHQSSKIKKQFPALHENLVTKTLQDIDVMRQKELNENYQQSDQISSDMDYLNQERRNLKGILSKQKQKPSTAHSQKSKTESHETSSTKTKIIKQVDLLHKINKLSSQTRKLETSNSFNADLSKFTQNVKRKISDYFTQKLDMDFCQKEESRILQKPSQFEKTLSASRSVDPYSMTPYSEQVFSLDRIDSFRQIQDSTQLGSAKKDKAFLIKRK